MRLFLCALALLGIQEQEDWGARVKRLSPRIEEIRGLKFKTPLQHREGTRKQYAGRALDGIKRLYGDDLDAAQACLRCMGLMPKLMSLKIAVTGFAMSGVQVWYEEGNVVHPREEEGDDLVANKIAEGLVDQHFPRPRVAATFDAQMALASLRQGDAEVCKFMFWHKKSGDERISDDYVDQLRTNAEKWEKDASKWASSVAPRFFVRGSAFSWRRGPVFVETLRMKSGWKAIAKAHADPPMSTEQILHPEKYPDDAPVVIDTALFEAEAKKWGYDLRWSTTLGELGVLVVLESHNPENDHSKIGAGWGGDRLLYFEKKGRPPLILWATVWDTEDDAKEFHAGINPVSLKLSDPEISQSNFVIRRKTTVAFLYRIDRKQQDALLEALWKCTQKVTKVKSLGD